MILAIANQKGGVGKTTTAINLGAGLGALERRVLLVDCDPQGNATRGLGAKAAPPHLYHALSGEVPLSATIRPSGFPNLDLVPSQRDLVGIEVELVGESGWEQRLKGVLAEVAGPLRHDPPRLPAVARPPDGQRAHRRGRRAGAAPVRVLRPRRDQRAPRHRRARAGEPEPAAPDRRHPADHVRRPHQPVEGRRRGDPLPLRRQGLRDGRARATSASPRRRATACRSSSTTSSRAAPRPTWPSPASSCGGPHDAALRRPARSAGSGAASTP